MIFPKAFATIFTSDKELVTYSAWALRIYMAGIFSLGFQVSCQQSFMALGQAKVSLLLACLRKIVLLIPSDLYPAVISSTIKYLQYSSQNQSAIS